MSEHEHDLGTSPGETLEDYHTRLVHSATATIEAAIASERADGVLPDPFVVLIEQRAREIGDGTIHVALFSADDLASALDRMGDQYAPISVAIRSGAPAGSFLCVVRAAGLTSVKTLTRILPMRGGTA